MDFENIGPRIRPEVDGTPNHSVEAAVGIWQRLDAALFQLDQTTGKLLGEPDFTNATISRRSMPAISEQFRCSEICEQSPAAESDVED